MLKASAYLLLSLVFSSACGSDRDVFGHRKSADPAPAPADDPDKTTGTSPGGTNVSPGSPMTTKAVLDQATGDSYLTNVAALIASVGLGPYHQLGKHGKNIKVAILDNGFGGLNNSLGKRLPPETELVKSPLDQMENTTHGTKLAEVLYALATGQNKYSEKVDGPKIILMNTNGFTNFKHAVKQVIERKVDIVLYAQVWQYFGNFDGKGFINAEVNKATKAGVLWINAAGNMGQSTYNGPVNIGSDGVTVTLPHEQRFVRFTVPRDQTPVSIALNWNDYKDTTNFATQQDLDLILEDTYQHQLGTGRLHQTGPNGNKSDSQYSAYPRETISTVLNTGTYLLRVEANNRNFTAASQLRLSIDGEGVKMLDQVSDNSVGIPADNPSVLTIGAGDVDYSGKMPASGGNKAKSELQVSSSEVRFSDGERHLGTSAASAIVAAGMAVFQGTYGTFDRARALDMIGQGVLATPESRQAPSPTFKLGVPRSR